MNQYLLLRDNKQSGPYSVEELVAKGLKSYDLVWLEGKSAAWRYPSELEELKPFAPAVEEQPYDRFYKKPVAEGTHETNTAAASGHAVATFQTMVQEAVLQRAMHQQENDQQDNAHAAASLNEAPIQHTISSNKIHVILPAGNHTLVVKNEAPQENEDQKPTTSITAIPHADNLPANDTDQSNHQQSGSLSLEEAIKVVMANAKDMQAVSSGNTNNTASDVVSKNTVPAAVNTWEEEPAPLQEQLRVAGNRRSKPNNYKMLLRGTIAACLVLGGIVIGLVINRQPSQPTDQATLDQLVSQLKEKEKQQQANNVTPLIDQPSENTELPDNSTNAVGTSNDVASEEPSYTDVTPSTEVPSVPANKEKQLAAKADQPVIHEPEMKIVPAVVTNKKEEKDNRNSPNANYARENIHQLVSVEASDFKTGVLGGISGLQLTVINGSLFAIDQVEVQLNYLGPEKRVVKTQTIVFNDLGAGIQKTLEVPRTNRGVSINYMIRRIQSKELGIAHAGF